MAQENGQLAWEISIQSTAEQNGKKAVNTQLHAGVDVQNVEQQVNSKNMQHVEQNEGQFIEVVTKEKSLFKDSKMCVILQPILR